MGTPILPFSTMAISTSHRLLLLVFFSPILPAISFQVASVCRPRPLSLSTQTDNNSDVEEYRNLPTRILSQFLSKPTNTTSDEDSVSGTSSNFLDEIDWNAPKIRKLPLTTLAQALDAELYASEWFVTGRVNPCYFSDSFVFADPDVKVGGGIEAYARGVAKIFDPQTARAQILSTTVSTKNNQNSDETANTMMITCTWRLSGQVNIAGGLTIKPYLVYTDFTIDQSTGLIVGQEDRFGLPQWDILLSALFPFLIGIVTAPPEPEPEPRIPPPQLPRDVLVQS